MKLKRATYRHLEAEIYACHDPCRAIRELRERIIHSSGREEAYSAAVGDGYASSAVEWRATQLADNIIPTRVGVDRPNAAHPAAPIHYPHACGGGPERYCGVFRGMQLSPRVWGWTEIMERDK